MADPKKPKRKYRVLVGKHSQKDDQGRVRIYKQGEVVESATDLCEKFNTLNSRKFEQLDEEPPRPHRGTFARPYPEGEGEGHPTSAPVATSTPSPPNAPAGPAKPNAPKGGLAGKKVDQLSVQELQALAAEEEIDLRGQTKKEEIVKILRQHGAS